MIAIRAVLEEGGNRRDLALFNLAIDSKFGACDLVALRVNDVISPSGVVTRRTSVLQQKTSKAIRFEISERSRRMIAELLGARLNQSVWLFPGRNLQRHLGVRQYARLVDRWVEAIGLDPANYGTHSLRRTKVAHLYRETSNLRAVQLLLGHSSLEHTVRYLGFDLEDALTLSESLDL